MTTQAGNNQLVFRLRDKVDLVNIRYAIVHDHLNLFFPGCQRIFIKKYIGGRAIFILAQKFTLKFTVVFLCTDT